MPLRVFSLAEFRKLTRELAEDTIIVIASTDEDDTYYEQNCNGITLLNAFSDAPAALILEAGQEITLEHSLAAREIEYLESGKGGTFLRLSDK